MYKLLSSVPLTNNSLSLAHLKQYALKRKLSLCVIKHHDMKTCGEVKESHNFGHSWLQQ